MGSSTKLIKKHDISAFGSGVLWESCVTVFLNTQSMKMLPVIYKELEGKRDLAFSLFLFDNASIKEEEQPAAQLEYYTWLNMVDSWTVLKEKTEQKISYLRKRAQDIFNTILLYRYNAQTKDNRHARESIDDIIADLPSLVSDDKKLFSADSDWAVGDLMNKSKQIINAIVIEDASACN